MKQEDKQLLLKDLCARLPYGVKTEYYKHHECLDLCSIDTCNKTINNIYSIEALKPYLFPMSSMTEEQINELYKLTGFDADNDGFVPTWCIIDVVDWLNAHHFDYRGLIDKGLAIDATGLNIY